MREKATIIDIVDGMAQLQLGQREECTGCKVCAVKQYLGRTLSVRTELPATPGDTAVIDIPERNALLAPILLFAVPLLLLFVALLATQSLHPLLQLGLGMCGVCAGLGVAMLVDRKLTKSTQNQIKIIQIHPKETIQQ